MKTFDVLVRCPDCGAGFPLRLEIGYSRMMGGAFERVVVDADRARHIERCPQTYCPVSFGGQDCERGAPGHGGEHGRDLDTVDGRTARLTW